MITNYKYIMFIMIAINFIIDIIIINIIYYILIILL